MVLPDACKNGVDGVQVPVPHFGVVLSWEDWHALADRLRERGMSFVVEPQIRFKGQTGEQATMFFADPSGNALEFKSLRDRSQLFAKGSAAPSPASNPAVDATPPARHHTH